MSSRFDTSVTTWIASPPEARISFSTRVSTASLRDARTTLAPRAAARRAVSKPMPLVAPVITITWSASFFKVTDMTGTFDKLSKAPKAPKPHQVHPTPHTNLCKG